MSRKLMIIADPDPTPILNPFPHNFGVIINSFSYYRFPWTNLRFNEMIESCRIIYGLFYILLWFFYNIISKTLNK